MVVTPGGRSLSFRLPKEESDGLNQSAFTLFSNFCDTPRSGYNVRRDLHRHPAPPDPADAYTSHTQ